MIIHISLYWQSLIRKDNSSYRCQMAIIKVRVLSYSADFVGICAEKTGMITQPGGCEFLSPASVDIDS